MLAPHIRRAQGAQPVFDPVQITAHVRRIREPLQIVADDDRLGVAIGASAEGLHLAGLLPPLYPEWLGDRAFGAAHGVRFPYVAGEMANGIASTAMVAALARAELLGFFGAAGCGWTGSRRPSANSMPPWASGQAGA